MAHEPVLEIYKLKLFNKETGSSATFRDIFREKLDYSKLTKPIESSDIFKTFHKDFIDSIDFKKYNKSEKKKKGFTLASDKIDGEYKTHISSPITTIHSINGLFEGGKYGIIRNLGDIDNTDTRTEIKTKNIVGDQFYFLLYTPLDYNEGILMMQGYSETKISDVVREHLLKYFTVSKKINSQFEFYIPESLKQRYLDNATFKSFKFTSGWITNGSFEDNLPNEYELEVKIEIIEKSKNKIKYNNFRDLLNVFGKSKFKLEKGGEEKSLMDFDKKSGKMNSKGKDISMDFEDEDNIRPVVLLKDYGVDILEGEKPDFEQIDKICKIFLNEIIEEILPTNAIKQL